MICPKRNQGISNHCSEAAGRVPGLKTRSVAYELEICRKQQCPEQDSPGPRAGTGRLQTHRSREASHGSRCRQVAPCPEREFRAAGSSFQVHGHGQGTRPAESACRSGPSPHIGLTIEDSQCVPIALTSVDSAIRSLVWSLRAGLSALTALLFAQGVP